MRLGCDPPGPAVPDLAHHAVAVVQVSGLLVQCLGNQVHDEDWDLLVVHTVQDLRVLVPVPAQLDLRARASVKTEPVALVPGMKSDHQAGQADVGAGARVGSDLGYHFEKGLHEALIWDVVVSNAVYRAWAASDARAKRQGSTPVTTEQLR